MKAFMSEHISAAWGHTLCGENSLSPTTTPHHPSHTHTHTHTLHTSNKLSFVNAVLSFTMPFFSSCVLFPCPVDVWVQHVYLPHLSISILITPLLICPLPFSLCIVDWQLSIKKAVSSVTQKQTGCQKNKNWYFWNATCLKMKLLCCLRHTSFFESSFFFLLFLMNVM